MIILPGLDTAGNQVGIWSFPQPMDFLHLPAKLCSKEVLEEVMAIEEAHAIYAGEFAEVFDASRREQLGIAMDAYINKMDIMNPPWWQALNRPQQGMVIASLLVNVCPAWQLKNTADAQKVLLVPIEQVHTIAHLPQFNSRRFIEEIVNWHLYWEIRK